jgi:hypothetical protein
VSNREGETEKKVLRKANGKTCTHFEALLSNRKGRRKSGLPPTHVYTVQNLTELAMRGEVGLHGKNDSEKSYFGFPSFVKKQLLSFSDLFYSKMVGCHSMTFRKALMIFSH